MIPIKEQVNMFDEYYNSIAIYKFNNVNSYPGKFRQGTYIKALN
jgi:hypothetical protein